MTGGIREVPDGKMRFLKAAYKYGVPKTTLKIS